MWVWSATPLSFYHYCRLSLNLSVGYSPMHYAHNVLLLFPAQRTANFLCILGDKKRRIRPKIWRFREILPIKLDLSWCILTAIYMEEWILNPTLYFPAMLIFCHRIFYETWITLWSSFVILSCLFCYFSLRFYSAFYDAFLFPYRTSSHRFSKKNYLKYSISIKPCTTFSLIFVKLVHVN